MRRISIVILFIFFFDSDNLFAQQPGYAIINSPDAKIEFKLTTTNSKLFYSVTYDKTPVIESSAMGLIVNGYVFGENLSIVNVKKDKLNETYTYRGVHSKAINRYNSGEVSLRNMFPFKVEVRVFNDGVAFRYILNSKGAARVEKDITEFILPAGCILWSQPNIKYYEGGYSKKIIDTVKDGVLIGPPVTIELPANAGYAAITEGGLINFAGMSLIAKGNRKLVANLSGHTERLAAMESPWRIIEIGKDLNELVNCDIIANVSPSYDEKLFPQGYNTDWIKPGRSVWSWLAKTRSVTLENMKHFSDLAAQLGFEYNLVDEGWSNWKDSVNDKDHWDMMKELVDYSEKKGVKIWVWKAYPDRKGILGIKNQVQRKTFFKKCNEIGIAGLKIDFFDNEAQEVIQFYQAALKDAAENKLMINFHGANKPTGETRTWPNEMTREAIRGMENRPPWANNNTILPFTRYLAGHADYTPVHFGDRMGEVSWAHHAASMIIFTSPFLCVGADPQSILDNPCKEMIQSIPPVWDETIVLPQSKIGELALFARRKGTTWFVAAMNAGKGPKTVDVDLSFLKGKFQGSSVKDDNEKQDNALLENFSATADSKLKIELNGHGGYVARFIKIK